VLKAQWHSVHVYVEINIIIIKILIQHDLALTSCAGKGSQRVLQKPRHVNQYISSTMQATRTKILLSCDREQNDENRNQE
jgi:hypothetical protein